MFYRRDPSKALISGHTYAMGQRSRFLVICLFARAAILPSLLSAQTLAPPPGVQVVQLTPQPGYFTEPSIAINPRSPAEIVAAYQDNAHVAFSADSGANW